MEIFSLIVRLFLAATFSVAGITKLADLRGTRQGIRDFGVPDWASRSVGLVLPLAELTVAILLIPASTIWWGSFIAIVLLLLFISAIGINLAKGRKPSCNCFGQVHSEPVGWSTLIRNLVLAAGAGVVSLHALNGAPLSVTAWATGLSNEEIVGTLIGICALVLAVQGWLTLYLLRENRRLLVRIEALGKPAFASSGLPLGSPAPPFELQSLYGGSTFTLGDLLVERRPIVLIFLDPDCGPCFALLPDIVHWQQEKALPLTIALISRGSQNANRTKIRERQFAYVLLQKESEVTAAYGVSGTPGGVLIGVDGLIASAVAMGSQEIADLIATIGDTRPTTSAPV